MFEQLDLFGGEPNKPREAPKKKFVLTPPEKVVEESISAESDKVNSKEIERQAQITTQAVIQDTTPAAEEIDILHNEAAETVLPTSQENTFEKNPIVNDVSQPSIINIPEDESLYSKQYYAISEVASMFNVNISLLRFWEKEFDILKPRKNRKGDRLFRPEDIKNLKLIYFLLREKKYTIEGARTFIKKGKKVNEHFEAIETLKNIRKMLVELKESLS